MFLFIKVKSSTIEDSRIPLPVRVSAQRCQQLSSAAQRSSSAQLSGASSSAQLSSATPAAQLSGSSSAQQLDKVGGGVAL
ncbi:MAG: hypothetical protein ACYST6_12930 [Planctomycetota bacterium]|jgi:hypothetical protein